MHGSQYSSIFSIYIFQILQERVTSIKLVIDFTHLTKNVYKIFTHVQFQQKGIRHDMSAEP